MKPGAARPAGVDVGAPIAGAPGSGLEERTRHRLAVLDAQNLRRRLATPMGADFCSNDYLGLAAHPRIAGRLAEAARRDGAGASGSRLLRGHRDAFAALETRFAAFKHAPRALYFGSGYLANLGVLATFPEEGDVVCSDELNHASLIDGLRLSKARRRIFPHRDVDAVRRIFEEERGPGQRFLVTESVFSMDGDLAPLVEYASICRDAGATLIVDEAHAVGVFGARGSGLLEAAGLDGDALLSINPCGKALGVAGAVVCGPAWAIEYLVQRARTFIYSTAPPPAIAAALMTSLEIVESEPDRRRRLHARIDLLRSLLMASGIAIDTDPSPIVAVHVGDNGRALAVADELQAQGFDIRAIRPPTVPAGTARLRVTMNVTIDEAAVRRFVPALTRALSRHAAAVSV